MNTTRNQSNRPTEGEKATWRVRGEMAGFVDGMNGREMQAAVRFGADSVEDSRFQAYCAGYVESYARGRVEGGAR